MSIRYARQAHACRVRAPLLIPRSAMARPGEFQMRRRSSVGSFADTTPGGNAPWVFSDSSSRTFSCHAHQLVHTFGVHCVHKRVV